MRLCLRSHDVGERSIDTFFDKVDLYRLDGIQLVCYKTFEGIAYKPNQIDAEFALRIKNRLGGRIPLIGAYFNPIHPDKSKVSNGIAVFQDYIDNALALGANVVGSETGSHNGDKWTYHPVNRTEESLNTVIQTFRGLCDYAAPRGVNVGIEGAAGHVCYDVATLKRAVEEIDRDNLKIIVDTFNFLDIDNYNNYTDILDGAIEAFAGRIAAFHIKDCIIEDGRPLQVPIGKGILDQGEILRRIKRYDPDASLVLEGTVGADIIPSVNYIRELWGKV